MLEIKKEMHISSIDLYNERFFTLENVSYKVPVDFEQLKTDKVFINHLSYITAENANFRRILDRMEGATKMVEKQISQELQSLKN